MAYIKRALGIAALLFLVLYLGDYVSLRYRIPGNREQFGTVNVRRSYAVKQKDGKLEYYFDPPADQQCVHSIFPHFADSPCWYVSRHAAQQLNF
jgi:hypothetical protein